MRPRRARCWPAATLSVRDWLRLSVRGFVTTFECSGEPQETCSSAFECWIVRIGLETSEFRVLDLGGGGRGARTFYTTGEPRAPVDRFSTTVSICSSFSTRHSGPFQHLIRTVDSSDALAAAYAGSSEETLHRRLEPRNSSQLLSNCNETDESILWVATASL